jgi:hypothetical protein
MICIKKSDAFCLIVTIIITSIMPLRSAQENYFLAPPMFSDLQPSVSKPDNHINFFQTIWDNDKTKSVKQKIRNMFETMAWLFSDGEESSAKIAEANKNLKIFIGLRNPYNFICFCIDSVLVTYHSHKKPIVIGFSFFIQELKDYFRFLKSVFSSFYWRVNSDKTKDGGKLNRIILLRIIKTPFEFADNLIFMVYITLAFGIRDYLNNLWKTIVKNNISATIFGNHVYFISHKTFTGDVVHECIHWLQNINIIASDMPLTMFITAYSRNEFEVVEMDDEIIVRKKLCIPSIVICCDVGCFQEKSLSAIIGDTYKIADPDHWNRIEAHKDSYAEEYTLESLSISKATVGYIVKIEQLLRSFTDQWYLFWPTMVYLRAHMFENKDVLFMNDEHKTNLLKLIYLFAVLITIHRLTDIGEVNQLFADNDLKSGLQECFGKLSNENRIKFTKIANAWLQHINRPRFQKMVEGINDSINPSERAQQNHRSSVEVFPQNLSAICAKLAASY